MHMALDLIPSTIYTHMHTHTELSKKINQYMRPFNLKLKRRCFEHCTCVFIWASCAHMFWCVYTFMLECTKNGLSRYQSHHRYCQTVLEMIVPAFPPTSSKREDQLWVYTEQPGICVPWRLCLKCRDCSGSRTRPSCRTRKGRWEMSEWKGCGPRAVLIHLQLQSRVGSMVRVQMTEAREVTWG